MKIDKYERIGVGKYRIFLDNGEIIDTYDEVILRYDLLLKKEISPSIYSKIVRDTKLQEYYHLCDKYISYRIRSVKEIEDYLKKKNVSLEDIEEVVDALKRDQLLDDDHFAECFIKDKLSFTTMGNYKIINELQKQHISSDIIDKYSYLMDDDVMLSRIERLVNKKMLATGNLSGYKLRDKIYRYLIGQGYSSSLVVTVLNEKF